MAETEKEKAGRLQKRREKQQAKRERTGDTPEAAAERRKRGESDTTDGVEKLGTSGAILFS